MISNNKALVTPRSAPNVDEGIESDSTIKQKNNDESIGDSQGVSTKGMKGDVSLPVIRSSLVTTSIVLDESVFSIKTVWIDPSGDSTGSIPADAVDSK
jgi:hypothetical protein